VGKWLENKSGEDIWARKMSIFLNLAHENNGDENDKTFDIELPRIYQRGPPPKVVLTPEILQEAGITSFEKSCALARGVLLRLYYNKKFSQSKIAKLFGVQRQTVNRWLKRLDIPLLKSGDAVSRSLSKHRKTPFSNNLQEKAYLVGLRCGDISAQKHGRHIRVSVSTTHPAMLKLFKSSFEKYGVVGLYPKYDKRVRQYRWSIYCDLNSSFDFLLSKPESIPKWIIKNDELFLAFLSGYFDAEGCLSLYYNGKSKSRDFQWILKSCDKEILDEITDKLSSMGFDLCSGLVKKADFKSYNKDLWGIRICTRFQIFGLLERMRIKHEEKITKHELACELARTDWKNAQEKIASLRNTIKSSVKSCIENAKVAWTTRFASRPRPSGTAA